MAPLTRNRAPGGVPNELMATYYAQRASAGLITSEGTQVEPLGQGYQDTPGIYSPEQRDGWRRVTDAVHRAGGRIFARLCTSGASRTRTVMARPRSHRRPSSPRPARRTPRRG